ALICHKFYGIRKRSNILAPQQCCVDADGTRIMNQYGLMNESKCCDVTNKGEGWTCIRAGMRKRPNTLFTFFVHMYLKMVLYTRY
ncbi:hypothetical protein ACJX0J_013892, partial [Zea mays]